MRKIKLEMRSNSLHVSLNCDSYCLINVNYWLYLGEYLRDTKFDV